MLPHVIDVDEAMKPDAPLLFEDMITRGVEPAPTKPSNISKRLEFKIGDIEAGFAAGRRGDREGVQDRARCIRPISSRMPACARCDADGQTEIWSSSQGHFVDARADRAAPAACRSATCASIPAEIGGGFGGKTVIYLEPVAALLSKKSGQPGAS